MHFQFAAEIDIRNIHMKLMSHNAKINKCIYMKKCVDTLNVYTYICINKLNMRIEDEIKQKSFRSQNQKLIVNLLLTGSWISFKSYEMLKPFQLTTQQYNVLRILRGQYPEPATINLLIDRMMDKMSNASRIVDRLEKKKLVDRRLKAEDRRCVDVMITDKGIKLLEKIGEREKEYENNLFNLTAKEAKILNGLLDKLRG